LPRRSAARGWSRRGLLAAAAGLPAAASWPEFRGDGQSLPSSLPRTWSETEHVDWSVATEGYGQSSPVIWDQTVYLTGIDGPNKESLLLWALDLQTGRPRWTHKSEPRAAVEVTDMISRAAPTPAVDAERLYAFFETGLLTALSHSGKPLWERRLTEEFGAFGGRHGIGSSLRLCSAGVLALAAHDGPSYLLCADRETGETVWKADREKGISWSTPVVLRDGETEIVLVSAGDRVEAFSVADGRALWTMDGLQGAFVASPTVVEGGAIVASSEKGQTARIAFPNGLTEAPKTVWRAKEAASYFSSPLVYRGRAYMSNKVGVAFCLDADTGEEIWKTRLKGGCWASPMGADGVVYFYGVDGAVELFDAAADAPKKIAENQLEEESRLYGAAASDGRLVLRYGRRVVSVSA